MPEEVITDKKQKAQDMLKELLGTTVQEAVAGLRAEIKAELDAFKTTIIETLPPSRKIRFDPMEAKAPLVTTGKLGDRGGYSFRRMTAGPRPAHAEDQ